MDGYPPAYIGALIQEQFFYCTNQECAEKDQRVIIVGYRELGCWSPRYDNSLFCNLCGEEMTCDGAL